MVLLLNILFAIVGCLLGRGIAAECGAAPHLSLLIGIVAGIIVFLLNIGAQVIR